MGSAEEAAVSSGGAEGEVLTVGHLDGDRGSMAWCQGGSWDILDLHGI